MWLGANKNNEEKPLNLKWISGPIRFLGIYIGHNPIDVFHFNFKPRIEKLKLNLNRWKQRKLSLLGKILIVKSLGVSQFLYLSKFVSVPNEMIKTINRIIYKFIWGSNIDKVKRNTMIQEFHNGGMKMIDIEALFKAQKIKWVNRYIMNHNSYWTVTMEKLISVKNLKVLLMSNFDNRKIKCSSAFYKELLQILCEVKHVNDEHLNLGNQFIYYNENVKINNKYVYNEYMLQAGMWFISDLYKNGNIIRFF